MAKKEDQRARFDRLRAKYVAAWWKHSEANTAVRIKYGDGFRESWLTAGERAKLERTGLARDKAGGAIVAYIQAISPRDWSRGVPVHWLYDEVTYEDVVRPVGEKLSVVPPLAYGVVTPMT